MKKRAETVLSLAALGLVLAGCLLVLRPFVSAILWATILCYCTWPFLLRLEGWCGRRRTTAAFLMTLLVAIVLVVPFVIVGFTLAENVSRVERLFLAVQDGLPPELPAWIRNLPVVGSLAETRWADFTQNTEAVMQAAQTASVAAGKWLLRHSLDFGEGVGQLILSVVTAFFFYRDGDRVMVRLVTGGRRILGDSTQHYVEVAGRTIRSVVFGIIGTGLAQAIMAGIGFTLAGVPSALLLALLTLVLSFVPAGPPLVWIPASIWVFIDGRPGWGVFLVLWGLVGISGIDNVVRPYFISAGSKLPFLMILLGVIGGILAFGFIGLFLGPVLLAVGYSIVREYTGEANPKTPAPPEPPAQAPTPAP